ncbi:MAG: hypothetical protein RMK29_01005 [Myxococcales bacterium]|nr:hypothetical protein [Myxococcota bacterium]MDW8280256.1 hypothetical protein [Myxococcales bacterium]
MVRLCHPPAAALGLVLCACSQSPLLDAPPSAPPEADPATAPSEVISASFSDIYQLFLRRTLSIQVRSERWARSYRDRWVRWTGQLAAITPTGVKFRHLSTTFTYDVSVIINEPQRSQLRRLVTVGKFYTYMARMKRFDDLFKTLYFDQGILLNPGPEGTTGRLVEPPPPLKTLELPAGPG